MAEFSEIRPHDLQGIQPLEQVEMLTTGFSRPSIHQQKSYCRSEQVSLASGVVDMSSLTSKSQPFVATNLK